MGRADYTGETLDDKYEVIELIGEGGMGAVYRGEHIAIGKPVAIKILHAGLAANEEVVKRFYREAQAAAAIRHSNIIDVVDLGMSAEGDPYLVMEYLEGEGLADHLKRTGPMDLPIACGILAPAFSALSAAHAQGIVHRDLKPDNIFLVHRPGEELTIKLIDFGISKFLAMPDQTKLTQDGSMLGTPAYMSPEQARGLDLVDHRTDIYSMGVIFYEMLTGGLPFTGSSYSELLLNMLTNEPRDPLTVHDGFPDAARPILEKALSKEPEDRFQSVEEMAEAVLSLADVEEQQKHLTLLSVELDPTMVLDEFGRISPRNTEAKNNLYARVKRRISRAPRSSVRRARPSKLRRALVAGGGAVFRGIRFLVLAAVTARWPRVLLAAIGRLFLKILRHEKRAVPIAVFGTLLVLGGLLPLLCMDGNPKVTITLKGMPEGATVFFENEKMTDNPFKVAKAVAPAKLRVEKDGKQPFEKSVVPKSNQVINVVLKDEKEKKKNSSKSVSKGAAKAEDEKSDTKPKHAAESASKEDNVKETKKPKRRKWRIRWPLKRRRKADSE